MARAKSLTFSITDTAFKKTWACLTYLPTINLIVFVKTPFRARARDTAGGRETHN